MNTTLDSVTHLNDQMLIVEVKLLAARERQATAHLIAALAEMDARRLYLGEGCSSLFTYCTQVLHLSEHAAYGRIEAGRAARRYPMVLELLAAGVLNLTSVTLLAAHLTADNHQELLQSAKHKSRREVEQLIAAIRPKPDVPSLVRKLPEHRRSEPANVIAATALLRTPDEDAGTSAVESNDLAVTRPSTCSPPQRPVVTPLAPERYKVQFTVSRETYDKLRRVQDLARHILPGGDVAAIFERAIALLLADLERTKLAATRRPRTAGAVASRSRRVPAAVKRAVWKRDSGRCSFVGTNGRCMETSLLEFHHVVPFAAGGETSAENLELRCRAHNAYEAEQYFGPSLFVRERIVR